MFPAGLTPERLVALEVAFKELDERHTAVGIAHGVQIAGAYFQMTAMGVSVSGLERSVVELNKLASAAAHGHAGSP